jgi:hypothetical protein
MANNTKSVKPFPIKDLKKGPHNTISETQFERWQTVLLNQIRKDANWAYLVNFELSRNIVSNRGITEV